MVRGLGTALRAVCIVIEGAGVQAAAVRSVFVALATILRPRFRWKTVWQSNRSIRMTTIWKPCSSIW